MRSSPVAAVLVAVLFLVGDPAGARDPGSPMPPPSREPARRPVQIDPDKDETLLTIKAAVQLNQKQMERIVELYTGPWGIWFLAGAAFTPIPYKVATIAAGATHMPFAPFVFVSAIGRGARFFLVAAILRVFGAPVRRTLEKNFDLAALAFLALLIGGFLVLKLL